MNEADTYAKMEQEILDLANKYSATRLQISTLDFDRDYRRGVDGNFHLVSTKAIVKALGKTTKVLIGDDQEFKTFEEAEVAVKKHWSEYYKKIRAKRTEAEQVAEAKRQKRYRERRKEQAIKVRQARHQK